MTKEEIDSIIIATIELKFLKDHMNQLLKAVKALPEKERNALNAMLGDKDEKVFEELYKQYTWAKKKETK